MSFNYNWSVENLAEASSSLQAIQVAQAWFNGIYPKAAALPHRSSVLIHDLLSFWRSESIKRYNIGAQNGSFNNHAGSRRGLADDEFEASDRADENGEHILDGAGASEASLTLTISKRVAEILLCIIEEYAHQQEDPECPANLCFALAARRTNRIRESRSDTIPAPRSSKDTEEESTSVEKEKSASGSKIHDVLSATLAQVSHVQLAVLLVLLQRAERKLMSISKFHFIISNVTFNIISKVVQQLNSTALVRTEEVSEYVTRVTKNTPLCTLAHAGEDDSYSSGLGGGGEGLASSMGGQSDHGLRSWLSARQANEKRGDVILSPEDEEFPAGVQETVIWRVAPAARARIADHSKRNEQQPNGSKTQAGSTLKKRCSSVGGSYVEAEAAEYKLPEFDSLVERVQKACAGAFVPLSTVLEEAISRIELYQSELEGMTESLSRHAPQQIYENEKVMTIGCTHSTLNFFLRAAQVRKFVLVILEGPTPSEAWKLSAALRRTGNVAVRVLPDSSAYAVMSSVSKIFVSCENVLATGGVFAPVGTHAVCLAAKAFAVPVIAITMTIKLSPWFPADKECTSLIRLGTATNHETQTSLLFSAPTDVLPMSYCSDRLSGFGSTAIGNSLPILLANHALEYVPPELLTLFITNDDECSVSHIYQLIKGFYMW